MSARLVDDWFGFCVFALVHWLGWRPLCGPGFLCVSVLEEASGSSTG